MNYIHMQLICNGGIHSLATFGGNVGNNVMFIQVIKKV